MQVGDPVASRTEAAPELDDEARAQRMRKAQELAAAYRIEIPPPPS